MQTASPTPELPVDKIVKNTVGQDPWKNVQYLFQSPPAHTANPCATAFLAVSHPWNASSTNENPHTQRHAKNASGATYTYLTGSKTSYVLLLTHPINPRKDLLRSHNTVFSHLERHGRGPLHFTSQQISTGPFFIVSRRHHSCQAQAARLVIHIPTELMT